ncbi:hypothetical protein CRM90_27945 [Mycobacterium sp. ENV421]|uniref:DUF4365 domain-containing protein n=1 Tax=Mycobacterium sp. ENV421 TaxID=1213407 RepID=UPI000C9B60C0|nr:DUF4365 domain-containing protein [Mycobacterium sp. ENV421]PND54435.1 hypothetical protein CRM90_27945 [Mycobacterium sp. ENV421]
MVGAGSIGSEDRIGRLGVMYVRSLLAQAGVIHNEIPGGEDYLAVDIAAVFPVGTVTVQVKTGTATPNQDGSISVSTTPEWRAKWANTQTPVFLVYVRLEKTPPPDWLQHEDLSTVLHARALWLRVNNLSAPTVKLPSSNRLTASTFDKWADEFGDFGEAAGA